MDGGGFDPARVVRLRIDAGDEAFQFGSGYVVAAGLALTAGHVVTLEEDAAPSVGARCEIKTREADWSRAEVVWASDAERDLALIHAPALATECPPTAWGMLVGTRPREWRAAGYPVASLGPRGRSVEDAWGKVSPVTQAEEQRLGLTV